MTRGSPSTLVTAATLLALVCTLAARAGERTSADDETPVAFDDKERARIRQLSPLAAPPPDPTNRFADDPLAAWLGQALFFDPRLSRDGAIACSTCHDPALFFADGKELPRGVADGDRNTPSVVNAAYQRWFFWDGRADTLWSQALKPIEDPREMDSSRVRVVRVVADDPRLRSAYEQVFGELADLSDRDRFPDDAKPTATPSPASAAWEAMSASDRATIDRAFANVGKAIAAYERRLISARAPFDTFAEGLEQGDPVKVAALSIAAQRGLRLFLGKANCRLCHNGPTFSDGEFHATGVAPKDGSALRDPGRRDGARAVARDPFNAAGEFSDQRDGRAGERVATLRHGPENWGEFKTPSLRLAARTAPFMHQGQLADLASVIRFYSTLEGAAPAGHHQESLMKPLDLSQAEQDDLVAFLECLSGDAIPAELRAPPSAPPPDR